MKKRKVHIANESYDYNGYGDSYVPLCMGPNSKAEVTYNRRQVTCKRCRVWLRKR